jgi:hypothetical protein
MAGVDDLVGRDTVQARARLDADQSVVERVGVRGELLERVDGGVLIHGDGELGILVPGAEVDDVAAVLLDVVGVGDRQPGVERHVVVAVAESLEDGGSVGVLELDVVALLLEDGLPEFARGDALVPAVEHGDGDVLLVAVLEGLGLAGAGRAAGEGERGGGAEGERGAQGALVHRWCFLSSRVLWHGCWGWFRAVPHGVGATHRRVGEVGWTSAVRTAKIAHSKRRRPHAGHRPNRWADGG